MKLIDKNRLLEGLEKLKQNLSASPIVVIEDVESLVESLEVKWVDLDKETRHYLLRDHGSPLSIDAFIEKAEYFIYSALNNGIMGTANIEDFMRLFKKYMKGGDE